MSNQGAECMRELQMDGEQLNEKKALLSFIEALSIRDTIKMQEKLYRRNKQSLRDIRIPKCLLDQSYGLDAEDFEFDEETIELIKHHFHLR